MISAPCTRTPSAGHRRREGVYPRLRLCRQHRAGQIQRVLHRLRCRIRHRLFHHRRVGKVGARLRTGVRTRDRRAGIDRLRISLRACHRRRGVAGGRARVRSAIRCVGLPAPPTLTPRPLSQWERGATQGHTQGAPTRGSPRDLSTPLRSARNDKPCPVSPKGCGVPAFAAIAQGLVRPCKGMKARGVPSHPHTACAARAPWIPAGAGMTDVIFTRMAQGLVRPCKRMKMRRRGLSLASVLGTPTFPERCFGSASGSAQHDNRGGEVPACAGTTGRYFHKNGPGPCQAA